MKPRLKKLSGEDLKVGINSHKLCKIKYVFKKLSLLYFESERFFTLLAFKSKKSFSKIHIFNNNKNSLCFVDIFTLAISNIQFICKCTLTLEFNFRHFYLIIINFYFYSRGRRRVVRS